MSVCVYCGAQLPEQAQYCATCGRAVGPTAPPPAAPMPTSSVPAAPPTQYQPVQFQPVQFQPPQYPQPPYPTVWPPQPGQPWPPRPRPAFFAGDWGGAFLGVGLAALLMVALAVVATVLQSDQASASNVVQSVTFLIALAAGGSISAGDSGLSAGLSIHPLSLTLVAFVVIGLVFVRRLRRGGTPPPAQVWLQAARVAVVWFAVLGIDLIVAYAAAPRLGSDQDFGFEEPTIGPDVATTLVFGLMTLAVVLLVAATIGLPGSPRGRAEAVRAAVAGPLRGLMTIIFLSCLATLAFIVVFTAIDAGRAPTEEEWREIGSLLLILLPNVAAALFLLGLGVPITSGFSGIFPGLTPDGAGPIGGSGDASVLTFIRADVRWWILVGAAALVLLAGAAVAMRNRSPYADNKPAILWFAGVQAVAWFLISVLTGISASARGGSAGGGFGVGFNPGLVLLYLAIWGAVASLLTMWMPARYPRQAPPYAIPMMPPPPPPPPPYYPGPSNVENPTTPIHPV